MAKRLGILLAAAAVLLAAGCAAPNKLVGDWTFKQGGMDGVATFGADGKFSMAASGEAPMVGKVTIRQGGTYKLDGDKLTITPTTMETEGIPAQFKPQIEKGFSEQKGKPMTSPIEWKNDDEFTASVMGGSITYKRKK